MEVDEALSKLGFINKWQLLVYLMLAAMLQPLPLWEKLSNVFESYYPPHHCKIPANSTVEQWIPKKRDETFESCLMYTNLTASNETTYCKNGWEYDISDCGPTTVSEWDLVCDKSYLTDLSQMVFVLGSMAAGALGKISDIFGRKPTMIIFLSLASLVEITTVFSQNFVLFCFQKFLMGFFGGVMIMNFGVYLAENTSKKNKVFVMNVGFISWGLNFSSLPIIVYFLRNWRYLKFFMGAYPLVVMPILVFYLPETVYWLHANGKIEEAEKILIKAGKINKVEFATPILASPENKTDIENNIYNEDKTFLKEKSFFQRLKIKIQRFSNNFFKKPQNYKTQYSSWELIKNKYLLRNMTFGFVTLFVNVLFNGLSYISASISSHRYLSSYLNFVVEVPVSLFNWLIVKRFGFKNVMMLYFWISTATLFLLVLLMIFADHSVTAISTVALTIICKFFIGGIWSCCWAYGPDLFPNSLRNQAIGVCYFIGRGGNLIAAFSTWALNKSLVGTYIIYTACGLLGAFICFLLPDTRGMALPESIEEIEMLYKKNSKRRGTDDETKPILSTNETNKEKDTYNNNKNISNINNIYNDENEEDQIDYEAT